MLRIFTSVLFILDLTFCLLNMHISLLNNFWILPGRRATGGIERLVSHTGAKVNFKEQRSVFNYLCEQSKEVAVLLLIIHKWAGLQSGPHSDLWITQRPGQLWQQLCHITVSTIFHRTVCLSVINWQLAISRIPACVQQNYQYAVSLGSPASKGQFPRAI